MICTVVTACALAFNARAAVLTTSARAPAASMADHTTIGETKVVVSGITDRPGVFGSFERQRDCPDTLNKWTYDVVHAPKSTRAASVKPAKQATPVKRSSAASTKEVLPPGISHDRPGVFGSYERMRDSPDTLNRWTSTVVHSTKSARAETPVDVTAAAKEVKEVKAATPAKPRPSAPTKEVLPPGISHDRPGVFGSYERMRDSPDTLNKWTSAVVHAPVGRPAKKVGDMEDRTSVASTSDVVTTIGEGKVVVSGITDRPGVFGSFERMRDSPDTLNKWTDDHVHARF